MSADGLHQQAKSAFCPFTSNDGSSVRANTGVCDLVTNHAFTCFRGSETNNAAAQLWFAPNGMPGSTPLPVSIGDYLSRTPESAAPRCFNTGTIGGNGVEDNVGKCVTVADDDVSHGAYFASNGLFNQTAPFSAAKGLWAPGHVIPDVSGGFSTPKRIEQMQAPTMPLIVPQQLSTSENVARRQVYYHQRHHPQTMTSNCGTAANELKNKNRFSATGASGKCTVVRDSKMSLSSSPPSPSAGSVGGSLGSSLCRSHFNPIHQASPMVSALVSSSGSTIVYFPTNKKVSDMSTSSTLSSYSSSSLSSTPSLTGVSPRKRRADEEEPRPCCRASQGGCSGHNASCYVCSASDVTAGVDHVRLCDRSSTGSVSPTEHIMRPPDWSGEQHRQKRSKNDNDEDDDVVFVSMETAPGLPKQKLAIPTSFAVSETRNPFATVPPRSISKSTARKAKKASAKRNARPVRDSKNSVSPVSFAIPTTAYPSVSCQQHGQPQSVFVAPSNFTTSKLSFYPPSGPIVPTPDHSKGYFLRSSVNARVAKKDINNNKSEYVSNGQYVASGPVDRPTTAVRYHTRSQQKRKEVEPISQQQTNSPAMSPAVEHQTHDQTTYANKQTVTNATNKSSSSHGPALQQAPADTTKRTTSSVLPDAQQRTSSAFKKIYDIRGIIGVGGGGTVYAGTRKADNVQVAIKQVPKAKVKRWGKLDGRVVPIEFELLHRAAFSGNKGVISMLDWYERRNSYILVMERPQPVIDLFDYLNQHGALPEKVAKNIFRQIVCAVRHCHANGVVHRDIKDENVLLNLHTSEAKLIDFGCGTMMKAAPYTEFAGTPEFYPPEWFIERKYEGKRVDAWSLGVLLFTMIEAEVPFQKEKDIIACELRHKRAQTTTSETCRHLIASMLQKDQHKRLTLEEVLQHPWFIEDHAIPTAQLQSSSNQVSSSPKVMESSSGVMSTRDLYVNGGTAPFVPPSPQSPPKSEQRQTLALEHYPAESYPCQGSPSYNGRGIAHVGPGSPVARGMQPNECIVRS